MQYNVTTKLDSIYFEDVVAKAILFRSAEKLYGTKPNAIGDMRYIVVPYAIAWIGMTANQRNVAFSMPGSIKTGRKISHADKQTALRVLKVVVEKAPELLRSEEELN